MPQPQLAAEQEQALIDHREKLEVEMTHLVQQHSDQLKRSDHAGAEITMDTYRAYRRKIDSINAKLGE